MGCDGNNNENALRTRHTNSSKSLNNLNAQTGQQTDKGFMIHILWRLFARLCQHLLRLCCVCVCVYLCCLSLVTQVFATWISGVWPYFFYCFTVSIGIDQMPWNVNLSFCWCNLCSSSTATTTTAVVSVVIIACNGTSNGTLTVSLYINGDTSYSDASTVVNRIVLWEKYLDWRLHSECSLSRNVFI